MIIAVTSKQGKVHHHTAVPDEFAVYEIEERTVRSRTVVRPVCGSQQSLAAYLAQTKVDLIICDQIGDAGIAALDHEGIYLVCGVSGEADAAVNAYINGQLEFRQLEENWSDRDFTIVEPEPSSPSCHCTGHDHKHH